MNNEWDCDLEETRLLAILCGGGSDGWGIAYSTLLSAVDEHEDVAA